MPSFVPPSIHRDWCSSKWLFLFGVALSRCLCVHHNVVTLLRFRWVANYGPSTECLQFARRKKWMFTFISVDSDLMLGWAFFAFSRSYNADFLLRSRHFFVCFFNFLLARLLLLVAFCTSLKCGAMLLSCRGAIYAVPRQRQLSHSLSLTHPIIPLRLA